MLRRATVESNEVVSPDFVQGFEEGVRKAQDVYQQEMGKQEVGACTLF